MTDSICAVCRSRPTPDGFACSGCASRASGHLAEIINLTPDARLVAAGLVRRGGGWGSNKPGSQPPLNDVATDVVNTVQCTLALLAGEVARLRGLKPPGHPSTDPIIATTSFLVRQVEWMRHAAGPVEPYAVWAFDGISHCAGRLRRLVNGPSEQQYLGPCGARVMVEVTGLGQADPEYVEGPFCDGDVYAYRGAQMGRCRACGAEVATGEREAWLDGQVRSHAFTAAAIADAYGINVKTIRTWANRGSLRTYWRTGAGIVAGWADPPEDEKRDRLHYVGDVLDLAATDAARREGARAARARRTETRAMESESAAIQQARRRD